MHYTIDIVQNEARFIHFGMENEHYHNLILDTKKVGMSSQT